MKVFDFLMEMVSSFQKIKIVQCELINDGALENAITLKAGEDCLFLADVVLKAKICNVFVRDNYLVVNIDPDCMDNRIYNCEDYLGQRHKGKDKAETITADGKMLTVELGDACSE